MTIGSTTPATWNDILSTTMHNYRKTLTDNIWESRPLLNYFMSKGRVRTISGGISIVEPIVYLEGQADGYSEWDLIPVTPVNTATAAQFDWKQLFATISISGLEEAQNNSKEMIVNLLEAKIMQAEETLKTLLNGMLYGTSAATTASEGFTSLIDLINITSVEAGGIVNEAWWASEVTSVGAVDAAGLEAAMRSAYNNASDAGNDRVDALFTDEPTFGFYESTLTPQVRYTDTKQANLGFQNLMFKNVPLFWDFQAPAGTMLGINSKYVGLTIHSDRNFKQSAFTDNLTGSVGGAGGGVGSTTANTIDARVSFISCYGNSTIRNRRRCFQLTGISEA